MNKQPAIEYFTEERSVDAVLARTGPEANRRLATMMVSLVRHLHDFVKEVNLTQEEWNAAIDFLTRTGQTCDEHRQEFILLSDVLGVSMLVDAVGNRRPGGATENTVLGPFHVEGAPEYEMGANICLDGRGESCLYTGRVADLDDNPIAGARIDVWSDDPDGFYDVQQPDEQPMWNNRGVFRTGPDGSYAFRGIRPASYPIPDDGPVGQLLNSLDRHPNRPAHMHFMVQADGYEKLTTHTFVAGDPWLDSDAVFGVKASLIAEPVPNIEGDTRWRSDFDFVLNRVSS